jgi:hypothetical protein
MKTYIVERRGIGGGIVLEKDTGDRGIVELSTLVIAPSQHSGRKGQNSRDQRQLHLSSSTCGGKADEKRDATWSKRESRWLSICIRRTLTRRVGSPGVGGCA